MAADIFMDYLQVNNYRMAGMTHESGKEMKYVMKKNIVVLFCSLVLNVSIDVVSLYLIQKPYLVGSIVS